MRPIILSLLACCLCCTSFSLTAQSNADSIKIGIADTEKEVGQYFNIVIRYDAGIDSIKWKLWQLGWTYNVLFYNSEGVIETQNIEGEKVICHTYELFPNKAGTYTLPNAILWSGGEGRELIFSDTLKVRSKSDSTIKPPFPDLLSQRQKKSIELEIPCPPNQTCTKAFFVDTSFNKGDTLTLVIGANKTAKFQIPEIKNFKYITHSTTTSTSYSDGNYSQKSYIAVKYRIEKNLKRIKTPTFKARIGARTQYIRKLKIKRPKN